MVAVFVGSATGRLRAASTAPPQSRSCRLLALCHAEQLGHLRATSVSRPVACAASLASALPSRLHGGLSVTASRWFRCSTVSVPGPRDVNPRVWHLCEAARSSKPVRRLRIPAASRSDEASSPPASAVTLVQSNVQLQLLLVNVFLYSLCFSVQAPVLPALVQSFGGDALSTYAHLITITGVSQLVGGLLCGPLFDAYGARWGLLAAFAASGLSYGLAWCATSLPVLFLSRLPTLWQHAALASRIAASAYASDASTKASLLGYLGLAASLGAVIGPGLGGWLASSASSLRAALGAATLGSLLSFTAVALLMPRDGVASAARATASSTPVRKPSLSDVARVGRHPGVPALLAAKAAMSFSVVLLNSSLALAATTQFNMTPADLGLLLSGTSTVSLLTQAFLIDAALARFSLSAVSAVALGLLATSFAGLATARSVIHIACWLVPLTAASSCLMTLNTAELNASTPPSDSGSINALDSTRALCSLHATR